MASTVPTDYYSETVIVHACIFQSTLLGCQVTSISSKPFSLTMGGLFPDRPRTFFSSAHGTFYRMDHISGHKTSLNEFKKTEIISSIFCNHNGIKVEINYRNKTEDT